MNKNVIQKLLICGIILVLFGVNYGAGIENITGYKSNFISTNESISSSSINTDWWPMFHHDLNLSGYTTSIAPSTNKVLWTIGTWEDYWDDPGRSAPAIVDGRVYIGAMRTEYPLIVTPCDNNRIYKNPIHLRSVSSGENIRDKVASSSSRWYEAFVQCLDAGTGSEVWKTFLPNQYWIWGSAVVDNGKVYITSADEMEGLDSHVFCLDALTGGILWNFSFKQYDWVSPIVYNGKVFVAGIVSHQWPKADCNLYCLDAVTGDEIYNITVGEGFPFDSPALGNGRLFISVYNRETTETYIYCVNSLNGNVLWSKNLLGNYYGSSAVIYDNTVIVSSTFWGGGPNCSGVLWCLDTETGAEQWNYTTDLVCNIWSTPDIAYGKVYLASSRLFDGTDRDGLGEVRCLNASTGVLLWNRTLGDFMYSSPAIADGKIYLFSADGFGNDHGDVYCLDIANGGLIWRYWIWRGTTSSPAIAEGRLYVATPWCFYAFDDSAPSDTPPTITITGPYVGIPDDYYNYNYTLLGVDPEGHDLAIFFEWSEEFPGNMYIVLGPSGVPIPIRVPFTHQGEYWIRARAQDLVSYAWSNWSIITINVSKPKPMFLLGFINPVEKENGCTLLNATFVFYAKVSPFKLGFLSSGNQIMILNNSTGHVGLHFIIGRFQAAVG
jgi:outer membrane protein assembly factor BamB